MSRAADAAAAAVDPDEVLRFARALIAAPSENPGGTEDEAVVVAVEILETLDALPARSDPMPADRASSPRSARADAPGSRGTVTSTSSPRAPPTRGAPAARGRARSSTDGWSGAGRPT